MLSYVCLAVRNAIDSFTIYFGHYNYDFKFLIQGKISRNLVVNVFMKEKRWRYMTRIITFPDMSLKAYLLTEKWINVEANTRHNRDIGNNGVHYWTGDTHNNAEIRADMVALNTLIASREARWKGAFGLQPPRRRKYLYSGTKLRYFVRQRHKIENGW